MLEAAAPAVSADEPEVAVLGEQLGLLVAVGLESNEPMLEKCFGFQGSLVLEDPGDPHKRVSFKDSRTRHQG